MSSFKKVLGRAVIKMFTDSRSIIKTVSETDQIFLFGGVLCVVLFCFVGLGLVGGFFSSRYLLLGGCFIFF